MLRVSLMPTANSVTLKLEGKLFGPWCQEVRRVCDQVQGGPISLDLFDVTYADGAGIELIRALLAGGARIERCSSFVAELLKPETI
jgi:hypothetical protein